MTWIPAPQERHAGNASLISLYTQCSPRDVFSMAIAYLPSLHRVYRILAECCQLLAQKLACTRPCLGCAGQLAEDLGEMSLARKTDHQRDFRKRQVAVEQHHRALDPLLQNETMWRHADARLEHPGKMESAEVKDFSQLGNAEVRAQMFLN